MLVNQNGWMNYKKKKGFTFIELSIYISLGLIVLGISLNLLISTMNIYKNTIEKNNFINTMDDFNINLDNIIKDNKVKRIFSDEDKLILYTLEDERVVIKKILASDNSIKVHYYEEISSKEVELTNNKLLDDISNFNVSQRGKLIFISFEKEGIKYKRCI